MNDCAKYCHLQVRKHNRWVIVGDELKLRTPRGTYLSIGKIAFGVCPYELLTELRKLRKCLSEDGPKVLAEVNARPTRQCHHECVTPCVT